MAIQKKTSADTRLWDLIKKEVVRQRGSLTLIPSENHMSPAVLAAIGSPLANKYSEGYPGKRYYPGNIYYDQIEQLAQERALKLFGLSGQEWSVNIQPYSGSPANLAVYMALCNPTEDMVLGFQLAAGGHLTHGHKVNFSGKLFRAVQYGINSKTGLIDYAQMEQLAHEHKPKLTISGLTAYPRSLNFKKFAAAAKSAGGYHLADISHIAGIVAAGLSPSPFPHADVVTMTTHKTLRGPRGAMIFSRKEISERIDRAVFPGLQGGPHNNTTAGIAQCLFEAQQVSFVKYQKQVLANAQILADIFSKSGLRLTTGGTENHLMVVDVRGLELDGAGAEGLLEQSGILANRNSLPTDDKPFRPNGIRIGTPAITTRGMTGTATKQLGRIIVDILRTKRPNKAAAVALCKRFPLPY